MSPEKNYDIYWENNMAKPSEGTGSIIIIVILFVAMIANGVTKKNEEKPVANKDNPNVTVYEEAKPAETDQKTEEEQRKDIGKEVDQVEKEVSQVQENVDDIQENLNASPYKGMVTMKKSAGPLRTTNPDKEYILLEASKNNESSVIITGWKIKADIAGSSITIPKAIHLVYAGSSGSELPITLAPGEKAYITTGRSPIGVSFRVNKCSGYYTQFQSFYPSLAKHCPIPEDEILYYTRDTSIFIDNDCMDYVDRMSKCKVPTKALPLTLSYACQDAIIETINYGACLDHHKDDPDFREPEWRVYLKRDGEIWREKNETIRIFDGNGKEVDSYSY